MLFNSFAEIQSTWLDFPDNKSLAVEIYMVGCEHRCIGCSNPELQKTTENIKTYLELREEVNEACKKYRTNKIVLVGGEPLLEKNNNLNFVKLLLKEDFNIIVYTGYDIDFIKSRNLFGFSFIKCGLYTEELKQESFKNEKLIQFASTNQKLYDGKLNLLSKDGKYYFKGVQQSGSI